MAGRYFNWKLAAVCLIGLVVLGLTAFGLRQWQRSQRSYRGLTIGTKAFEEGDWEQAAKQLGSYIGVVQNDVPALLKYAQAQMNIRPIAQGNIKQAMGAYHTVLRLDAGNVEAAKLLGELYIGMNMPSEAELVVSRSLQNTSSIELRKILVVSLAGQRKSQQTATELKTVLRADPNHVWAYEMLGRLAEQQSNEVPEGPAYWFDKGVNANPASAEAYIARGAFFLRAGRKNDAIADLDKAEQMNLSDSMQRLSLAQQFINAGLSDKAKKHLEIVQAVEPRNQTLWVCWAEWALQSDSNEASCWVAQTGLNELSAQPYDFMPLAVQLYIRCGQLGRAAEYVDTMRLKEIFPATTAYFEGVIAEKKGKIYEAVKSWRRAIELGSKSASVRLSLAVALSRLGDKPSAVSQLRTLVSEQPNNFQGRMMLARLLAEMGQWSAAVEQVRLARQISPQNADAALFEIQVRLQMINTTAESGNAALFQEMKDTLSRLDKEKNGTIEVKLVDLQLAIQRGDLINAGAIMATLEEKYPDDPRILAAQAKLLVAQDKTDEAIELLTESFRRFPDSIGLLGHLVGLLGDKGRFDQAEQIAKSAFEGAKTPLDKRELGLMLADLYAVAKQQDKRFSMLNLLSQQFQDDVPLMCKLLFCQEVSHDSIRAQKIIDRIKTVAGENNWQWRYEQAKLWYAQKEFESNYPKIVSLLGENLLSNPDDQQSRFLLAEAHNRAGKVRLAISTYEDALNRSPRDARIIARLAGALYGANEFARAETVLQQAAKNGVENPDLKQLELQGYLRRGQLNSAGDVLGDLLKEDPNNDQIGLSLALLKMRQGDFLGARTLLDGIAGRDTNSIAVTAALIELKVRQGMGKDALELCKKVIQEKPNAFTYILRGRVLVLLDDKQSALDDFKRAVEMEPNNIDAWLAKIDFVASIGLMEDAITDVEKALVLDPNNLMVQKRAVALLLSSDKADLRKRGQSMLNSAIEVNPSNAEFLLQKAKLLLASNTKPSIQQATDILEKITETNPASGEAWLLWAQTEIGRGQTSKAIDVSLRGLVYRPDDKSLLVVKASAEAIRSPSLAIPTLKAVLEHEPNDIGVVILLAETYVKTGEYDKGIQLLKSQLLSSQRAEDWYHLNLELAVALYKSGKVPEANEVINTLYESAPEDPRPLLVELGLLKDVGLGDNLTQKAVAWCTAHPNNNSATIRIADLLATAKNDQANKAAESLYRRTIERDSNLSEGYLKLGTMLQMNGRPADAANIYKRLLEISPENTIAINNLAWILCEQQNQYNEALTLAERGLTLQPDYADLIDTRGMAYYRLGRMDKAVEDFRRCALLYTGQPPALVNTYFHLGRALVQLGQKAEARGQLSKALELNGEIKALSPEDSAEANRLIELLSKGGS